MPETPTAEYETDTEEEFFITINGEKFYPRVASKEEIAKLPTEVLQAQIQATQAELASVQSEIETAYDATANQETHDARLQRLLPLRQNLVNLIQRFNKALNDLHEQAGLLK